MIDNLRDFPGQGDQPITEAVLTDVLGKKWKK